MTEISYSYSRPAREFGRMPEFQANESEILADIAPNEVLKDKFTSQNPKETQVQNVPQMSEASTNTDSVRMKNHAQFHCEGGWPNAVDPSEFEEKMKYCKKVEREEGYLQTCTRLAEQCVERCVKQNTALDIYGRYFPEAPPDEEDSVGPAAVKVLAVLKDPSAEKRTAAALSWQNDGRKIAVAYSRLKFQSQTPTMSTNSHIWDILNPNEPSETLVTPSPLCSIEYYTKDPHLIAGGSWNGVVQFWDTRQPNRPAARSLIEESHKDPVWAIKWLQSKSGELLSVSTDGNVFVWDCRLPEKPVTIHSISEDNVVLQPRNNEGGAKGILGGLCLDYDPQVGGPAKYMIGTEEGTVLSCNRKGKTQHEKLGSNTFNGHHGPIYSVQRNPIFSKYFLTVGDWSARLWFEDFKFTPMFSTFYHKAYLTCGAWHTVRPGVFFTTRMDGYLDVWDLMLRQTTPSLSYQVSDYALHTLKPSHCGKYIATGGIDGNVSLMELSPSLCTLATDEKNVIGTLFENESLRDKNLDRAVKEKRANAKQRQRRSTYMAELTKPSTDAEVNLDEVSAQYMDRVEAEKTGDADARDEAYAQRLRALEDLEDGMELND
ncbi:putative dynein [Leptomonas pyrrhocoris]|uniref:Putative dynein n=1 Tax=Leptomonas pyrrhocoris TaxID=157538 RepID=A0A0N0DYY5_LEPPY|nr:putative dynein [Leptomonas pyrrhocoris]KPA84631.1 putative dynein [Leptomonas pyrrhocoris]|eukprot:XP_015663070.1 putative dynein [Leptomonas pyrrhocoris]